MHVRACVRVCDAGTCVCVCVCVSGWHVRTGVCVSEYVCVHVCTVSVCVCMRCVYVGCGYMRVCVCVLGYTSTSV